MIPQQIIEAAQKSQEKWKIPASVSIAQWALESNWGKSMSGQNNPFGIKALTGMTSTPKMTWEVIRGQHVRMVQNFANFKTMDEAFDLHGKLLAQGNAYKAARMTLPNADRFANALTGTYATDPKYGAKLRMIMGAHDLYQYDKVAA